MQQDNLSPLLRMPQVNRHGLRTKQRQPRNSTDCGNSRVRPCTTWLPTPDGMDNRQADTHVAHRLPTMFASGLTRCACPNFETRRQIPRPCQAGFTKRRVTHQGDLSLIWRSQTQRAKRRQRRMVRCRRRTAPLPDMA